ncbi:hypothetical protein [Streptomyces sp. NPDC056683]|uniref:hypothetical protein n=1 Tax=Streptomyces sp. NPDC056683 TaxID=3345910 RepID=UPI0036BC50DF
MSGRSGGSAGEDGISRLRRFQERVEPVVTRILLLGIFVTGLTAQFVKPVGDALEGKAYLGGALLSLVGYVLYDQVKELTSSVRAPSRALVNSTQLDGFVSEAFEARRVEISFLGYTGETLHSALYHHLEDLFDHPGPTRRVLVRMLVPDFGQPMTVPSKVGEQDAPVDDPDFRKRMEQRCREYDGHPLRARGAADGRRPGAGRVRVPALSRDPARQDLHLQPAAGAARSVRPVRADAAAPPG